MGLINNVRSQLGGQKALRTHMAANKLANEGQPAAAKAKYEEALHQYEQIMAQGCDVPNVYQGYIVLLLRLGRFDMANDVMQKMRMLKTMTESDWFDLRFNYSTYLWKIGELDKAIEVIGRAAAIKKNAAIYTALGMYLVDKARITGDTGALEAFNAESMDYDDEDAGILDNVGGMYEIMMNNAEARGDAEKAAECRAKAKEYFEKAHKQRPKQITTIYSLMQMYYEDGELDRAREMADDSENLYYSGLCAVTEDRMEALKQKVRNA